MKKKLSLSWFIDSTELFEEPSHGFLLWDVEKRKAHIIK